MTQWTSSKAITAHGINSKLLNMACKALNNLLLYLLPLASFYARARGDSLQLSVLPFLLLPLDLYNTLITAFTFTTIRPLNLRLWYQKPFLVPQIWVKELNCACSFSFHSFNFYKINTFHQNFYAYHGTIFFKCVSINLASYPSKWHKNIYTSIIMVCIILMTYKYPCLKSVIIRCKNVESLFFTIMHHMSNLTTFWKYD